MVPDAPHWIRSAHLPTPRDLAGRPDWLAATVFTEADVGKQIRIQGIGSGRILSVGPTEGSALVRRSTLWERITDWFKR